ncbi:MAG: hypothetical protein HZC41_14350 [Chloroflexi bacterium]|nr:hypothetical protein [Chloroflexota bacterium]
MGRLTAYIFSRFRQWEHPAQVGMALALALLLVTLAVAAVGPANLRQPALIGAFGLLFAAQIIFMWANRHLVTPFTRAQRAYLAEDFATARQILETLDTAGQANVRALTLLGNTYRQLGLLGESEDALTKALNFDPADPFPRYGFGRTLLVKGLYADAAEAIARALADGAPPVVRIDLAEALYRQGRESEARPILQTDRVIVQEPYRLLLVDYLLYRMGAGEPPAAAVVRDGLPFWQDQARRFQHTPYGQALLDDVRQMQALLEEK